MAHTAFIHGRVEGPYKDEEAAAANEAALSALPEDDDWPWLDGSIFSIPKRYSPGGTRTQLIHFGLCLKEDLSDSSPRWLETWLMKFRRVLDRLTWHSASVCVERDGNQTLYISLSNASGEVTVAREVRSLKHRLKRY